MADGVQGAAAGAGFRHAEHLGLGGDEAVARQKSPFCLARIPRGIFAAHGPAAFLDAAAQGVVGRRVSLVDGRAQKRDGGHARFHRGAVALAVQPVGQAADDDHPRLGHGQCQVIGCLPPVGVGAAGAYQPRVAAAVEAGRVPGDVQCQGQIGQGAHPRRVGAVVGGQHGHPCQQAVVHAFLVIIGAGAGQLLRRRIAQAGGRHRLPAVQRLVQFYRVRPKIQQFPGILAAGADGPGQPEPGQFLVHITPRGNATAARCPPHRRSGFRPGRSWGCAPQRRRPAPWRPAGPAPRCR